MTAEAQVKKKRAATVTRRYGGVDAAERRRERQRKLIDAGLELFGTRGYHLTTVRDVCGQAGLTERYFYESFKTLGELFDAVYAELRSAVQRKVMEAVLTLGMSSPDPVAMGDATLRAWYGFLHDDPRRARVMLIDAMAVSDNGMRGAEAAINEYKGMLGTFLRMLYPNVDQVGLELDIVVSGLAGATIYIAKNWVLSGFKQPLDEIIAHNLLIYRSMDHVFHEMAAGRLTLGSMMAPKPAAKSAGRPGKALGKAA